MTWLGLTQLIACTLAFCPLKNCIKCTVTDATKICEVCTLGYFLDSTTNTCLSCGTVTTHCDRCSADGKTCYSCFEGRVLQITKSGTKAVAECLLSQKDSCSAVEHCGRCTVSNGTTTCSACVEGFVLNAGTCKACPANCLLCSTQSKCTYCEDNYTVSPRTVLPSDGRAAGTCTQCTLQNCEVCYDANVCNECAAGYHRKDDGTCTNNNQCNMPGCKTCNSATNTCTECYKGYYKEATDVCTLCSSSMLNCIVCSEDGTTCFRCQQGYYLLGANTCRPCSDIMEHCQACSSNLCTACDPGYELMIFPRYCKKKTITDCGSIPHCLQCTSETQCVSCEPGYSPCSNGCTMYTGCTAENCGICKTDPDVCDFCVRGYSLTDGRCVAKCKDRSCRVCSTTAEGYEECSECLPGYYLDKVMNTCTFCGISNCENCTVAESKKNGKETTTHSLVRTFRAIGRSVYKIGVQKLEQQSNRTGKLSIEKLESKLQTLANYYSLSKEQHDNLRIVLYDHLMGGALSAHLFNDSSTIMNEVEKVYAQSKPVASTANSASYICLVCANGYSLTHNICMKQTLTTSSIIGITAGVVITVGLIAGVIVMLVISKTHK